LATSAAAHQRVPSLIGGLLFQCSLLDDSGKGKIGRWWLALFSPVLFNLASLTDCGIGIDGRF
jgi:hypothetical protein